MVGRGRRADSRPLVVLMSFTKPGPRTNPYITMLAREIPGPDGPIVKYFSWRMALIGRYDVFHVHWPELRLGAPSLLGRIVRRGLFSLLLVRLAIGRTPVVRTVHNIDPHEGTGSVDRWLLRRLDSLTTAWVRLNPTTPARPPITETILHGHYVDWFAAIPQQSAQPGRIVFAGLIREYKNVPALVRAFTALPGDEFRLCVVGMPSSHRLEAEIAALAAQDAERVELHFGYVDDHTLVREVTRAELAVLPYLEMHNSGAALMALSLGRPILVPDSEAGRRLAQEVGPGWVHLYRGHLDAADLARAITAGRTADRVGGPDLTRRNWDAGAAAHRRMYQAALTRRAPTRRRRAHPDEGPVGSAFDMAGETSR